MNEEKSPEKESDIFQLGNVDKIRELLFSSESKELKDKFEKIENSINSMQEDMRNKIEQSKNYLDEKINDEIETITRKIKNITTQQQNEFSDVRDDSLKLEKRLQNSIKITENDLNAKYEQFKKQQTEMRDALKNELLDIVDKKISELDDIKFSRNDIANFFMEAAMSMEDKNINQQHSIKNLEPKQ